MPNRTLDQNFELPPNVVDLQYEEKIYEGQDEMEVGSDTTEDTVIDYIENDPAAGSTLLPPDNISVVEYIVKIGADGTVLVDVVLDVEGTPGTSGYEAKVTKI